jgi:hypothetical protein
MSTYPGGYEEAEPVRQRRQYLTPSKDLGPNWEVVEGPEIQGWDLLNHTGERIGKIDDVLMDTDTGRAVFAIAVIGAAPGVGGRRTLIPVHLLDLDADGRRVIAPLSREMLMKAPEFTDRTVNLMRFHDFWDQWRASGPAIEEQEARQARKEELAREEAAEPGRVRVGYYRRIIEPEERRAA